MSTQNIWTFVKFNPIVYKKKVMLDNLDIRFSIWEEINQ